MAQSLLTVKDFGAVGDEIADDTIAIQNAINSGSAVIPVGNFRVTSTLFMPQFSSIIGLGNTSVIRSDYISGAVIQTLNNAEEVTIDNLKIIGTATTGIFINESRAVNVTNVQISCDVDNSMICEDTWGSYFSNIATNGSFIANTCFTFGNAFNANLCDNLYTSNSCLINILVRGGHGSTFNMLTCQNGRVGLSVQNCSGHVFNGLYAEDTAIPVLLGEENNEVQAITINGGSIALVTQNNPYFNEREAHIKLVNCDTVSLTGIELLAYVLVPNTQELFLDGIYYGKCKNVSMDGLHIRGGADLPSIIKRLAAIPGSDFSELRASFASNNGHSRQLWSAAGKYYVCYLNPCGNLTSTEVVFEAI